MSERGDADCAFKMRNGVKQITFMIRTFQILLLLRQNQYLRNHTHKQLLLRYYYLLMLPREQTHINIRTTILY
jgi:hypothetical protein